MKEEMYIYYDEEGDLLEFNTGDYTEGYFKNIGDGIAERIDEKTGKVTGLAILSFRKRIVKNKDIKISLPLKLEISS